MKVSRKTIEDFIVSEQYVVYGTLTMCIMKLKNEIQFIGTSACVDTQIFDAEVGKMLARDDAIRQCWLPFGFHLACIVHRVAPVFEDER